VPMPRRDPAAPVPDIPDTPYARPVRPDGLGRRTVAFDHRPDAQESAAIAAAIGAERLRKVQFAGTLRPVGKADWLLEATLGATVVQPCVATLAPVTTRIDRAVTRRYTPDPPMPEGPEAEMPEDDTVDPLGDVIDPGAVMVEELTLALPDFPRAGGAEIGEVTADPPGAAPIDPARENPFAGLAALRDSLDPAADDDAVDPADDPETPPRKP